MHQSSRSLLACSFAVPLLIALTPASAVADTKSCIAAHASAQREAKAGHPKQSAQLYTACGSDNSCPEQLRSECAELLEQVKGSVPSVIFAAIDGKGGDLSNVKVYSDDTLLLDALDGRPVELDPGKYHFRFVLPDGSTLVSDVLVREGEKNRVVEVHQPEERQAAPSAPARTSTAMPSEAPPPTVNHGAPVAAWVATGVAALGFATFGTFAILGSSDKKKLNECAPNCADSERDRRDSLKTKFLVADIGLGVGAASAILAGVLFLTSGPSDAERRAQASKRGLSFDASASGGGLVWRGQF